MTSESRLSYVSDDGKGHLPVQSAKDLAVILDPNLSFDDHITSTGWRSGESTRLPPM